MSWIVLLLAIYLFLGLLPPGRLGSRYVTLLGATGAVLAVVFAGLGR
jgi:hypothetical protein